jgi:hypothetical protein
MLNKTCVVFMAVAMLVLAIVPSSEADWQYPSPMYRWQDDLSVDMDAGHWQWTQPLWVYAVDSDSRPEWWRWTLVFSVDQASSGNPGQGVEGRIDVTEHNRPNNTGNGIKWDYTTYEIQLHDRLNDSWYWGRSSAVSPGPEQMPPVTLTLLTGPGGRTFKVKTIVPIFNQ